MTDTATPASPDGSPKRMKRESTGPAEILARLEEHKEEHPECMEYWFENEIDAAYLLLAMAASLKHMETDVNNDTAGVKTLRKYAHTYRQVVQKGDAMKYLRDLTDADALSVYGMRIRARKIILN